MQNTDSEGTIVRYDCGVARWISQCSGGASCKNDRASSTGAMLRMVRTDLVVLSTACHF